MPPRRLTADDPEEVRRRYAIVRTDTFATEPGLIKVADADQGICILQLPNGGKMQLNLGPGGLAIVPAGRR